MNPEYHEYLRNAFEFFNRKLFNNELSECIITLSRHRGALGFFSTNAWGEGKHELAVTRDSMFETNEEMIATFVHEMCHLWQQEHGKPSPKAYHNKQWAYKMLEVGLTPISLDAPEKMTGFHLYHKPIENGVFLRTYAEFVSWYGVLLKKEIKIPTVYTGRKHVKRPYAKCDCNRISLPMNSNLKIFCENCQKEMEIYDATSEFYVSEV